MSRKIVRRSIAMGAAVGLGSLVAMGASSPAAASDSNCGPATALPVANTYYDNQNNYKGTRIAHQYNNVHLVDAVYDTYGPGYRQVEVWQAGGLLPPQRIACERKPSEPVKKPEEPAITPATGGWYSVNFHQFGFRTFLVGSPAPRSGTVTVGEVEAL